jgi:hypothetical protein
MLAYCPGSWFAIIIHHEFMRRRDTKAATDREEKHSYSAFF